MFLHLNSKERLALVGVVALAVFGAGFIEMRQSPRSAPVVIQEEKQPPVATSATASEDVVVHVAGAVNHPGVYKLKADQRVDDAVKVAGGFTKRADADRLNLAAKLVDGTQVFVPSLGSGASPSGDYAGGPENTTYLEAPASGSIGKGVKEPSAPINLNSATAEQLQTIPGVGPSTAQRILDYRKEHGRFKSVDEMLDVGGIGDKKLSRMKKWLRI